MTLSGEQIDHKRRVYAFLDLSGDFGGILEVGLIFFGLVLGPWAEH